MPRRLVLLLLVAALALLAVPTAASAKVNISVGIGDQSPQMFADANWKALGLKKTRYFIEWNAIDQPTELAKADAFVAAANLNGVRVLMHVSTDDINSVPRSTLPSVNAYRAKVKKLVQRYKPRGVKDWGVWNEVNHKSQPTQRNPRRAAQFFTKMRGFCSGCTIVALDVLDQAGVESYIRSWFRALGRNRTKAKIIGIHNYSEVNRKLTRGSRTYPGTRRIINAARAHNRSTRFWYTETGGLVKFGPSFPCDTARAADRIKFMFDLAKTHRRYVKRLYTFNWTATAKCALARFDAGLINPDGSRRPGYNVLKNRLAGFKK